MSTNATSTDECSDASSLSTATQSLEISGPHTGYDAYGNVDHSFYRCESCGRETTTSPKGIFHTDDCLGN